MIVVSVGCPSGVGPEVSVTAAARLRGAPCVLVGDEATILEAAELVGVPRKRFATFRGEPVRGRIAIAQHGPRLGPRDRRPGRPSKQAGRSQLGWIGAGLAIAKDAGGRVLVTGPVSKWAIARSGARGAASFRGHTEFLRDRDHAATAVMCFASDKLVTSLVTTHLPLAGVPAGITKAAVARSTVALANLLAALGRAKPLVAVASLNPHAGESELLGGEERRAVVPGIADARRELRGRARVLGPVAAETAFRRAVAGDYDGVVAMYHDQATIPMKIVAFGDAVNVTMGLSVVRTSVDHGTAYDIAWSGRASADGMLHAMKLAVRLART